MIQASPISMKPNMTGLNQTGFGASSPLACSARAGFDDFVRAMRAILSESDGLPEHRPIARAE